MGSGEAGGLAQAGTSAAVEVAELKLIALSEQLQVSFPFLHSGTAPMRGITSIIVLLGRISTNIDRAARQ